MELRRLKISSPSFHLQTSRFCNPESPLDGSLSGVSFRWKFTGAGFSNSEANEDDGYRLEGNRDQE
jgi:hypothetical protein